MKNISHTKIIVAAFISLFSIMLNAQQEIEWISIEEAIELRENNTDKKYFIDIYTDWCGWCKKMDRTTFANDKIINLINENYIPIKFNAEQKVDIQFEGKEYSYVKRGRRGYHELATELMRRGKKQGLSYPTYIFLDEDMRMIQPLQGYQTKEQLQPILIFFGEDHYKETSWEEYQKLSGN